MVTRRAHPAGGKGYGPAPRARMRGPAVRAGTGRLPWPGPGRSPVTVLAVETGNEPAGNEPAGGERVRHGLAFGPQAAAYAAHRPDYPDAAVAWALAPARGSGPLRVLDLGAGTGKLTGVLARHADAVVAVEPDLAMLAELRRALPGSQLAAGRAERIPLRDASVDAVLAGQSAHWFDLRQAIPEIARVLRPGGVLAGLWNTDDDRASWVAGLAATSPGLASVPLSQWRLQGGDAISRWLAGGAAAGGPGAGAAGAGGRSSRDRAGFGPPEQDEFGHWQPHNAGSLVATIATHSTVLLMEPAERDQALATVREYLAARPETAAGSFRLPIVTCVMRAVRRPA